MGAAVATSGTTSATYSSARRCRDMKVDAATPEGTHPQQQFNYLMSRQEDRSRDITTNSGRVQKTWVDVMTSGDTCSNGTVPGANVAT